MGMQTKPQAVYGHANQTTNHKKNTVNTPHTKTKTKVKGIGIEHSGHVEVEGEGA
jgi:hypothetical protein